MKTYYELLDFKTLGKIVLTADSPGHLLEKFKKNTTVQDLNYHFTDEELISAFYEEMKTKHCIRKDILLYSLATALWFQDSIYVIRFFKDLVDNNYSKCLDNLAVSYFSQTQEIL